MDETIGLRLIEKLKEDTEKFRKEGGAYQLLQEYFHGLSKETLRDLLCYKDKCIRQITLWIIFELGETAKDLLEEVVLQMNDDDPAICYYSSEIVACIATDEYMDDFMRVFGFFDYSNAKIRTLSMFSISKLGDLRIQEAYTYLVNNKILSTSHEKGLLSLIHVNALTPADITDMINSDDNIIRKYGVIAASKVYEKYPEMIKESVNSEDDMYEVIRCSSYKIISYMFEDKLFQKIVKESDYIRLIQTIQNISDPHIIKHLREDKYPLSKEQKGILNEYYDTLAHQINIIKDVHTFIRYLENKDVSKRMDTNSFIKTCELFNKYVETTDRAMMVPNLFYNYMVFLMKTNSVATEVDKRIVRTEIINAQKVW